MDAPTEAGPAEVMEGTSVGPSATQRFSIHVKNLSMSANEDTLRVAFAPYGTVNDVYLPRHKGTNRRKAFGFVQMSSAEEVQNAIQQLNNTDIAGKVVLLEAAREDRKTPREMRARSRGRRGGRGGSSPPRRSRNRSRDRRRRSSSPRRRDSRKDSSHRQGRRRSRDRGDESSRRTRRRSQDR